MVASRNDVPTRRARRYWLPAVLLVALIAPISAPPATAVSDCVPVMPSRLGWAVDLCRSDPSVPGTMAVSVDGVTKGSAALVRVYHLTDDGARQPQIAVVYQSGFVRLKQNADPIGAPIPFGASAVLGPALWRTASKYWHNPTLSHLDIATGNLPSVLYLRAIGTNHDLDVIYRMALQTPTDARTTMAVDQVTRARTNIPIDPARTAQGEGAKTAAQISTLHIPTGAPCNGGLQQCHDVDQVRFVERGGILRVIPLGPPGFILPSPAPLGGRWLNARHSDDIGWQGNTPSLRVCTDYLPAGRDYWVQGFVAATTNPNDDNVGVWISDQWRGSVGWRAGESEVVRYRLVAQDDFADVSPNAC